jgi:hypothetical protein
MSHHQKDFVELGEKYIYAPVNMIMHSVYNCHINKTKNDRKDENFLKSTK